MIALTDRVIMHWNPLKYAETQSKLANERQRDRNEHFRSNHRILQRMADSNSRLKAESHASPSFECILNCICTGRSTNYAPGILKVNVITVPGNDHS